METKNYNRAGIFEVTQSTWAEGGDEKRELLARLNYHFTHNDWENDMEMGENGEYYL